MRQVVRVLGLVKLAGQVRVEIGRGVGSDRKRALRETVARAVGQVDGILKERGARPSQLAGPSRRAYEYLARIRWDDVAEAGAAAPAAAPDARQGALRFPGLGTLMNRIAARLAGGVSDEEVSEIAGAIRNASRRVERSVEKGGITPERLSAATREQRGWFAWLAEPENLREYVDAVGRARVALDSVGPAANEGERRSIEFRPMRHIYKLRTRGSTSKLLLPTAMVRFDAAGFEDLARLVYARGRDAKGRVVERMRSEAYADLMTELDALGGVVEGTRGAFHDLVESFARVNGRYFGGTMKRPRLSWSATFTRRKFGHYDHVRDWVMVSSTLDQAAVPAMVVDFLVYHELLHKKHGIRWVNGRAHAHTAAFYTDERRFEGFAEAEAWLKKLARG